MIRSEARQRKIVVIDGTSEHRQIAQIAMDSGILHRVLSVIPGCRRNTSFSLMLITTDIQVLLLERSQSFHFPKALQSCRNLNKVPENLGDILASLYSSELKQLRSFLAADNEWANSFLESDYPEKRVRIFPGGHCIRDESVIDALIRELREETSISVQIEDILFNKLYIFNVLIYDRIIHQCFDNFVFPAKIQMTSSQLANKFKETKHTRNASFVDVSNCKTMLDAFIHVQNFMIL